MAGHLNPSEVEAWACEFVQSLDPSFACLEPEQKLVENLFKSGRLDSMNLMAYLLAAESEFEFTFTPESFQDSRLETIAGLVLVINELKSSQ